MQHKTVCVDQKAAAECAPTAPAIQVWSIIPEVHRE